MKENLKFFVCVVLFFMNLMVLCDVVGTYYPLKEGMRWEYQVSSKSMLGAISAQKVIITNFAPREMKGKIVIPQKVDFLGQSTFAYIYEDSEGVVEFATQLPSAIEPKINQGTKYYLKYPLKVGTSWIYDTNTFLLQQNVSIKLSANIESIDEIVTVPVGTFKHCVKVKMVGNAKKSMGNILGKAHINVENYDWFAPGVGTIKSIREEKSNHYLVGTGGMFSIQLESYKK